MNKHAEWLRQAIVNRMTPVEKKEKQESKIYLDKARNKPYNSKIVSQMNEMHKKWQDSFDEKTTEVKYKQFNRMSKGQQRRNGNV